MILGVRRSRPKMRSKSLDDASPLVALDERISIQVTKGNKKESTRTSTIHLPEHRRELFKSSHRQSLSHRPSRHRSLDLLDQSIKAEEKSRRERATSRTSSLDDALSSKQSTSSGHRSRSRSIDESSPLAALDERINYRDSKMRRSVRPSSMDRDVKYAEKVRTRGFSLSSMDSYSDDDSHDGSLMDDILDQRSKAKVKSKSVSRSNSNDRGQQKEIPTAIQAVFSRGVFKQL